MTFATQEKHLDELPPSIPGGNDPPRNLRPVTEAEIVAKTKFGTFSPKYRAFGQVYVTDEARQSRRLTSLHMLIYADGHGVAYSTDYWAAYAKLNRPEHADADRPSIQWFRFDGPCDHHYEEARLGNAYHRYTCTKCGYTYEVDSSG